MMKNEMHLVREDFFHWISGRVCISWTSEIQEILSC